MFYIKTLSCLSRSTLQGMFYNEAKVMLHAKVEGEAGERRKRHSELQDQLQQLANKTRLFEKGLESIEGVLWV